ncbi:MAG: HNH endonuclease signature motif containing protein [Gemmataceae bacterium]
MRPRPDPIPCGLCGRPFDRAGLTKHHCRPKSRGGTTDDVELLCSQCHSMVHCTYENKTLAGNYASLAELRQAPELQKFIRWVRKQPPTQRSRNRSRRKKF